MVRLHPARRRRPLWADYTLSASFRLDVEQNYPGGLRGRIDPATGGSYAAWVYPGQGKIKLWRHSVWHIDTSPTTVLAEANVSISTGVFHTLAVTFDGSQIPAEAFRTLLTPLERARKVPSLL